MKEVRVTTRGGGPVRATVTDMETGEVWKHGTTVNITRRSPWMLHPRLVVEVDSAHIDGLEDVTIIIEREGAPA